VTKPDWQFIFGLDTDRHRIGRSLFIRGMGIIYLVAIASWWSQVALLVGETGLAPAARLVEWITQQAEGAGRAPFWSLPGLFWLTGTSDFALHLLAFAGCLLSLLVIFGRLVGPALAGLWLIYLSFVNSGGVFMSFQWDILLLEAGFLSLFLCRWEWKTAWLDPPPLTVVNRIALVWSWLLIAKLMFFSGWVKLAWDSETHPEWWSEGTAMTFHYMTQPLPTWTAWWAHHLPVWFHKASLVPMYIVELALPFAVILGRWGRLAAFWGFTGLMILILLTGNYTYFNWLTIALCLPLLHDRLWPEWLRRRLDFEPLGLTPRPGLRPLMIRLGLPAPAILVLALLNLQIILRDLHRAPRPVLSSNPVPAWLESLSGKLAPFHLASGYGLFRTMTTERPEIIIEGSSDGLQWLAYDFAWKVDGIADRPRFVAPHQPRVAWQFWFAALEGRFNYRSANAVWIESLVLKLLEGDHSADVLIKDNPFPDTPPRLIRARLMRYEFTSPAERRETGNWWKRVVIGEYLPAVSRPSPSATQ
jgi:hypothetical protein